jgi:ribosomal protein S8
MKKENYISAREVFNRNDLHWVKSYLTVLKYIKEYKEFLKPITMGRKTGRRYFVKPSKVKKLVKMFELNLLKD